MSIEFGDCLLEPTVEELRNENHLLAVIVKLLRTFTNCCSCQVVCYYSLFS